MLKFILNTSRSPFSKISQSLKLLQLSPPTTQKQIKGKYMQLAKQLHPDIMVENGKNKSAQQIKRNSQAFIEATKAYKYLRELSEIQINNDREEQRENRSGIAQEQEEYFRVMTEQEKRRKTTQAYFNRRYKKPSRQQQPAQKKPLYKLVPQLFFGMFLVFLFLLQWANAAIHKSRHNIVPKKRMQNDETFEGMNFRRKYQGRTEYDSAV